MQAIDIHSHIIFAVDDGSKTIEQSIQAIKQIKKIGMNSVVCTPHFKRGRKEKIGLVKTNFLKLKEVAQELGIELYIGNEIMYSDETIELLNQRKLIGINFSKYILVEFKRNENKNINDILMILEDMIDAGYRPILAHPELYINYHNIEYMRRIKEIGVMLQMDATSLFERKRKKLCKKMLKERLVDVVASDSHCTKKRNHLIYKKAYKKISKKYGKEYTDIIFYQNPLSFIQNK